MISYDALMWTKLSTGMSVNLDFVQIERVLWQTLVIARLWEYFKDDNEQEGSEHE